MQSLTPFKWLAWVTALFSIAIVTHSYPFNGPSYWAVGWRSIPLLPIILAFAPLWVLFHRLRDKHFLVGLFLGSFLLRIASVLSEPLGFESLERIVLAEATTGYFTDAIRYASYAELFANFHLMPLTMHSSTHPPGTIVFYRVFIDFFGQEFAPIAASLTLNLIVSFTPICFYFFCKELAGVASKRAAILFALCPGFIFLWPSFEPVAALIVMGMGIFWSRYLRVGYLSLAWAFLSLLVLLSMLGYHFFSVGTFFAIATWVAWRRGQKRIIWLGSGLVFVGFFGFMLGLWYFTGYDFLASFRRAISAENGLELHATRPYFWTLFLDPYVFLFAIGVHFPVYFSIWLKKHPISSFLRDPIWWGFGTLVVIHLSGLLRAETERIWVFILPMLFLAVIESVEKLEEKRFRWVVAMNFLLILVMKANITYLRFSQ